MSNVYRSQSDVTFSSSIQRGIIASRWFVKAPIDATISFLAYRQAGIHRPTRVYAHLIIGPTPTPYIYAVYSVYNTYILCDIYIYI